MAATWNVLFLCTGNSGRSILAESILRQDGMGRFNAFSAGTTPKGAVHQLALKVLRDFGYPAEDLSSKSWNMFSKAGAPEMDFVFTVCDDAAGETCPVWPGEPATAHWGIEDPARVPGSDIEKEEAFVRAFGYLRNRIALFVALPLETLDRMALHHHLREIGQGAGSTSQVVA